MVRLLAVCLGLCVAVGCSTPADGPAWVLKHHGAASPRAQAKEPPADARTEGDACPTPDTEVAAEDCEGLPEGYGLTPEHPVEWGLFAAGGNQRKIPYFGRLLCGDGNPAYAQRLGTSSAPRPSSSPPSMHGRNRTNDGPETLDHWKVECGNEVFTFYSNIKRCGSHCVPRSMRLASARGMKSWFAADDARKQGDLDEYHRLAAEARASDPGVASFERTYFVSLLLLDRIEEALEAAEEAVLRLPGHSDFASYRIVALSALERWAEVETRADALLQEIEGTEDRNLASVLCRRAVASKHLGKPDEEASFRKRACEAGEERCCPKAEASATE